MKKFKLMADYFKGKDMKEIAEYLSKLEGSYIYCAGIPRYHIDKIDYLTSKIWTRDVVIKDKQKETTYYDFTTAGNKQFFVYQNSNDKIVTTSQIFVDPFSKAVTYKKYVTTYALNTKRNRPRTIKLNDTEIQIGRSSYSLDDISENLTETYEFQYC